MAWKKGESGNPAGKPKGAVSRQTKARLELESIQSALRTELDNNAKDILNAMIFRAVKAKNVQAGMALLSRLLPASAPICPVVLEGTPAERADMVLTELAAGRITEAAAKALLDGLATAAAIRTASDTATRLESLEKTLAALTGTTDAK